MIEFSSYGKFNLTFWVHVKQYLEMNYCMSQLNNWKTVKRGQILKILKLLFSILKISSRANFS